MGKIRAFLATNTSQETQKRIAEIQSQFKQIKSEVRWESKDKFHVTLKFLGDIEENILREMGESIKLEIENLNPFTTTYKGIGCFPNLKFPRVIWIGGESEKNRIFELNKIIEDVASNYNFAREKNKFHPHITLGRVKGEKGLNEIIELIKEIEFNEIIDSIDSIDIMQSILLSTGSIYKTLYKIPLKK